MKFSVGYRVCPNSEYMQAIIDRKNNIEEIYFSWADFPNGRNNQLRQQNLTQWEAQQRQIEDIKLAYENGIKLNVLFNANCYGKNSQSRSFFEKIAETVDYLQREFELSSLTTTSILIAKFIKENFHNIEVRASVNMSIGTIESIDYVSSYFDSFYIKRELNRDFKSIKQLKSYCEDNGKKIHILANSGCLNNCSAHTFHDNLVSHESDIEGMDNGYQFEGICKEYFRKHQDAGVLLSNTNFIRPEDVYLYEGLFHFMKLATRVNQNPINVLKAYIDNKTYIGSIFNILEPDNSSALYPHILDNSLIIPKTENDKLVYNGELIELDNNMIFG